LVTIGADGRLLNRHRTLIPTDPERMIWGQGDASGLRVVDTNLGRLGGLSAGRPTCRWPGTRATPPACTSTSHRPGIPAMPGWRPCATSPARAAAG
jgi:hypothetical protein